MTNKATKKKTNGKTKVSCTASLTSVSMAIDQGLELLSVMAKRLFSLSLDSK